MSVVNDSEPFQEDELDDLFPIPSLSPAVPCPQRYPGISPQTVAGLRHVLKDNHIKHQVFCGEGQRLHNHISYRALALYATGASGTLIEHFYKKDSILQRPVVSSPEAITEENFIEHLGNTDYHAAYVAFFVKSIKKNGISATLDKYIFSKKYNFIEGRDIFTQPAILIRFLVGVLHPFIHVGYGTEFGIPGMVVEGLSMASMQESRGLLFLPSSIFEVCNITAVEGATAGRTSSPETDRPKGSHAFSILAKVIQDPQFAPKERHKYIDSFKGLVTAHAADIWRYTEQWAFDLSKPDEIDRKMEECIWTNTIIYTIGGWSKEKGFIANLFFMHLVTSSIFLPSMFSHLSQDSQVILLRAYFTTTLAWWISRCGPQLDIQGFFDATDQPSSDEDDIPSRANAFLDFVQFGMTHPDDHMLEIQRAFAHFSSIYGARPKGYFKGTELEGADALDGSLFFRAAKLTNEYMNQGTSSWSDSFKTN